MVGHQLLPSHPRSLINLFFLLIFASSSYCEDDIDYTECVKPFNCGVISNLSYPFWSNNRPIICGDEEFNLRCEEGEFPVMNISNQQYKVLSIDQSRNEMTIARMDLWDDGCPENFYNTTLNATPFNYVPGRITNISLFYNCTGQISVPDPHKFPCPVNGEEHDAFYTFDSLRGEFRQGIEKCNIRVEAPFSTAGMGAELRQLMELLRQGFNVAYDYNHLRECIICNDSSGICGTNSTTHSFSCLCPGQPYPSFCPTEPGNEINIKLKLVIGFGAAFGSVAIMCFLFFIYLRRKKNPYTPSSYVSQSNISDFSSKSDMESGGNYNGVQLFTYEQLEEATNNFDSRRELGEGGFGTVYYGKLHDGRAVAVKRLYENNYKRVEQFMNEVGILTHLRHPHLVSLYGCTSRHSRELLLVYEYIPNGTVADHVHGEKAKPGALPWPTRLNIAVETATALAYLHASDIIHRDVKTNNILLDHNFCVKVADFGLSRLFPLDVTHISTAPQGTPGYVDPEYHECYQLTDKSDVYSFGVVLIELISSMPAVDITRHRHEINLSNMAINKIQSNALDELVDHGLGFDTDYAVRKMITAVAELAFQCLQSAKELRPSMEKVLETLKEIKNKDYNLEKKEEMNISSDDVGLLKFSSLHSPDTVMIKWKSTSTTPNTSG